MEHLIDRFNLPAYLKTEAVLVKEDQDRLIVELSQIFKGDRIAIVKDPRLVQATFKEQVKMQLPPAAMKKEEPNALILGKRKPLNPVEFYSGLFGWN